VLTFGMFKLLATPVPYGAFTAACHALGREHDAVISGALRGFPGAGLMPKIRQQPSAPLLALLARRVTRFDPRRVARRAQAARTAIALMPGVDRPGTRAAEHSYWVFPIQAADPDGLVRRLWRHGFDATRGASSMSVVDPPPDRPELEPREARRVMDQVLYLPVYPGIADHDLARLAHAVAAPAPAEATTVARETG